MPKEVIAKTKFVHISAQKARLIVNQVRGMNVELASRILSFSTKKAAGLVKKTLDSAISNAESNFGLDIDDLVISTIYVDKASQAKRFRARARGRANQILKRHCHIVVVVSASEE